MKLVVQIPCYNEAETLPAVLADIPREIEGIASVTVLVVDDGSSDETADVAKEAGADVVVQHPQNRGLAATFATGIQEALQLGADIIVNTDGDHQYPGTSIKELVAPIVEGKADIVIGNRDPTRSPDVPRIKRLMYALGNFVVREVTGIEVHDAPSGFRAMSRDFAQHTHLTNAFSYTLETLFTAAERRCTLVEIPIRPNPKLRESRLFGSLSEYVRRSAGIILKAYAMHKPMRAFGWLSLPFILLGLGLGVRFLYYFLEDPERSGHIQSLILAAISTLVGVQIFIFGMLGELVRTNRLLLQKILSRSEGDSSSIETEEEKP